MSNKNNINAPELLQCIVCGFLENGHVEQRPCPGREKHTLEPLSPHTLAVSLGRTGGRPPVYLDDESRRQARLETFRRSNAKRRGK